MTGLLPFLVFLGLMALIFSGKLPGSRSRQAENDLPMPKRIFAIIVFLGTLAFFIGTNLAAWLWLKVIPYCVFGTGGVSVKVVIDRRQYVQFSNGVMVHGLKFFLLELIWVVFYFVFVISLLVFFVRVTTWLLKKLKPALGDELCSGWKALLSYDRSGKKPDQIK